MSAPAIQAALQQMQGMATQASSTQSFSSAQASAVVGHGGFGGELQASIQRINRLQQTANSQAMAFQAGDPNLQLNDVMADMQKSSVAFQMGLQVRNRLVSAYRDVMNMQV
ncbi:flagellar hook-basal body complex protein FliE [Halomonas sp. FeN2]|mgnify:FL=1|uniref:Flagellar hook-basal body complex protein FliE n=1 Tax=Vreelandella neptunia TaxID=115551 RepID=A0ABZ0YLX0_9GAMM|nr:MULTISPECIES: flagellar hook-basal body complex protein FliE [Halomonas]TDV89878.1 flagellar hook-basal body complex protein FliE [Halomonas alkaliantarctica]MBF58992.1 flagellar hook-basal body complex protein FliE [Halomonas sp.]MDN3562445.1 flagellar hook-basal body complex protein FliE [Halomonas neptunia]UBR48114.1 flagellar hook-basal body complex protein FliE [Halomonas sp. FeN2]WQH12981.1 flagellar hook-basal body complex protein FliE [Halomonas neptunia]|tara:strand:- start:389 stop:721 length:333 start_codon:yes stop_codon:yes gene_type:complete